MISKPLCVGDVCYLQDPYSSNRGVQEGVITAIRRKWMSACFGVRTYDFDKETHAPRQDMYCHHFYTKAEYDARTARLKTDKSIKDLSVAIARCQDAEMIESVANAIDALCLQVKGS